MDLYMPEISSYAGSIDRLVWVVTVLVGVWFVLSEAVFFWFCYRFRARDGVRADYITGEDKRHTKWVSWPHFAILACDIVIIVMAVRVWYDVKQTLEPPQATVRIVAQQWAWIFQDPGPDGQLDTADDVRSVNELHLQVDTVYNYELQSRDVLHSLSIPVFRLKHDAIPGRTVKGWFKPVKTGDFDIQCAEICGLGHALMPARLHVETAGQHAAWLSRQSAATQVASLP